MKLSRAAVIFAVLVLAGCQGTIEEPTPSASEIETKETQPETETEPEVTQEAKPAGPQDCLPSTQLRIEESIDSQTAA